MTPSEQGQCAWIYAGRERKENGGTKETDEEWQGLIETATESWQRSKAYN